LRAGARCLWLVRRLLFRSKNAAPVDGRRAPDRALGALPNHAQRVFSFKAIHDPLTACCVPPQATYRAAALDIRTRFDGNRVMPNFLKAREALAAGQVRTSCARARSKLDIGHGIWCQLKPVG